MTRRIAEYPTSPALPFVQPATVADQSTSLLTRRGPVLLPVSPTSIDQLEYPLAHWLQLTTTAVQSGFLVMGRGLGDPPFFA